jgi:hypothetical protein
MLYGRLREPLEDTAAAHWIAISALNDKKFFLCALGSIQGYSPMIDWIGPFLKLDDFYEELNASGYVLSDEQVDKLADSELMKYWEQEVP